VVAGANVEIVRVVFERFNSGDVDGLVQLIAPEFEFHDLPELPGAGGFVDRDSFIVWRAQLVESFDDLRFEPLELIEAGPDRVVSLNRVAGRGKGSGIPVEGGFSSIWTLRDGLIVKHVAYRDHAEALAAAES
jgi:ketosteroid isomerase-like protein